MEYKGKMYRPWMEADSVLIQTTYGCSHNSCTFCTMFDDKKFQIRPLKDILEDIEEIAQWANRVGYGKSVFLTDGNALVMKTSMLLEIMHKIKECMPQCTKISLYASYNDLRKKSIEDLRALKEAGLAIAYVGLESGDRTVLEDIHKDLTPEEAIEGMEHARAAGIEVLASIIFGMGGHAKSRKHIEETTKLINILKPEQLAPMTLTVQPHSKLEKEVEDGIFIQATGRQIIEEELYLLENLDDFPMFYWGDHANNVVSKRGMLKENREAFIKQVKNALKTSPIADEKVYETMAW